MQDLNHLIGEHTCIGIFSTNDVGNYFWQFLLITRYLIGKNQMSTADQLCNFCEASNPK